MTIFVLVVTMLVLVRRAMLLLVGRRVRSGMPVLILLGGMFTILVFVFGGQALVPVLVARARAVQRAMLVLVLVLATRTFLVLVPGAALLVLARALFILRTHVMSKIDVKFC